MTPRITIYSTSHCKYCIKAKEFFKKIDREFEEVLLDGNPVKMQELVDTPGFMSFPIIKIGGRYIQGFNPHQIAELL